MGKNGQKTEKIEKNQAKKRTKIGQKIGQKTDKNRTKIIQKSYKKIVDILLIMN